MARDDMNQDHLLLVKFEGAEPNYVMEAQAQSVNDEYMRLFGEEGAFTIFIYELSGDWDIAIRYVGPAESVGWLENAVQKAAGSCDGSARTTTVRVIKDITGLY